ncbi:50S ribosomal protein L5 [Candidatus Falkowbacteria bacterium RBG_13_39_14]|uniref:Large ribosomal subunit protein uL5 n=1 Tax=Candidatus Falkowbacteria bacterium RBG_13_39_14 TaxID=1797985 RepID=A0A1F5S3G7_9BACT|nr:MAG: 50S ribosomal protein L5 [Candidatus Falkowbacteria bacterium RBG_13_39_14]
MNNRLYKKYKDEVLPKLKKDFNIENDFAAPRIEKVIINVGLGKGLNDKEFIDVVENNIMRITGQKPIKTKARKSISNFKIRKGLIVGMKVTLRQNRMYDFLDKLFNVTFPRVRDFRGISPKTADREGNITVGIKEHICFPEVKLDEVEKIHGLEATIVTTAKNNEQCVALLQGLGFPFKKEIK